MSSKNTVNQRSRMNQEYVTVCENGVKVRKRNNAYVGSKTPIKRGNKLPDLDFSESESESEVQWSVHDFGPGATVNQELLNDPPAELVKSVTFGVQHVESQALSAANPGIDSQSLNIPDEAVHKAFKELAEEYQHADYSLEYMNINDRYKIENVIDQVARRIPISATNKSKLFKQWYESPAGQKATSGGSGRATRASDFEPDDYEEDLSAIGADQHEQWMYRNS